MSIDLDAIRERCEAATPGPWGALACGEKDNSWAIGTWAWPDGAPAGPGFFDEEETDRWLAAGEPTDLAETHAEIIDRICEAPDAIASLADAEFIAHARTDVPALLDAIERLRTERRTWGGGYRYICEEGHTTVTTDARYDVCSAVLPWWADHKGTPCGAPTEYRVIPYDAEFDL